MPDVVVLGISTGFPELSPSEGQIAHVLLTRSPLVYSRRSLTARLACVKHAASVRPEPGSNSPLNSFDVPPVLPEEGSSTLQSIPARRCSPLLKQSRTLSNLKESSTDTEGPKPKLRLSQPADWRYKLIRRLLAHC